MPLPQTDIERQLPTAAEVFLDHVGHFVADADAAAAALARAGFCPAPRSIQVVPDGAGGTTPTGTGNVTAMFRRGYIEVLFKTADTALGREFDGALARYAGVHLAAFSVADARAAHARLAQAGFRVRPVVDMQRPVDTIAGADVAAFTIARVEAGEMAEGRMQFLTHHAESAVWQPRWLDHPNGAVALVDVVVAVADRREAAARFGRFLDRPADATPYGDLLRLERGGVLVTDAGTLKSLVPDLAVAPPPFIGVYAVSVLSLDRAETILARNGLPFRRTPDTVTVPFPDALGTGAWIFVEGAAHLPWRRR